MNHMSSSTFHILFMLRHFYPRNNSIKIATRSVNNIQLIITFLHLFDVRLRGTRPGLHNSKFLTHRGGCGVRNGWQHAYSTLTIKSPGSGWRMKAGSREKFTCAPVAQRKQTCFVCANGLGSA